VEASVQGFIAIFDKLDDPRAANAKHSLFEVMFAALCAGLCGLNLNPAD
jgi:hypothetical protein